jgi:hypothetical protein
MDSWVSPENRRAESFLVSAFSQLSLAQIMPMLKWQISG